jgi:membrane-bound lytic murein transglycosylase D
LPIDEGQMRHISLTMIAAALLTLFLPGIEGRALANEGDDLLVRPAALEKNVQFWIRVYTEVSTDGGLLHDSRHLDVVYQVVRLPKNASRRTRERHVEGEKKQIRKALRSLARGRRDNLSAEEARVLALWPEGVSNATLRAAASRIRFQLGQADKFRAGVIRSGAWLAYIRQTFEEMGLPADLAALPHVESSYTPHAYSRVGAAGLWQFTRSTGRRFMRVDYVVDERLDPFKATLAAARLLEQNLRVTGSWPLAITAYNHGASGMRRAARKLGTRDITTIVEKYKSRTFGFASRNFYVEFLAARQIASDPERYFGPLVLETPIPYESYELPWFAASNALPKALGIELSVLKASNPALRSPVWNGAKRVPRGFELRVPRHQLARPLETAMAELPSEARFASQTRDSYHKVQRGETLSRIAARYHVSARELASLNGLRNRNRIRAGQLLRLPEADGSPRAARRRSPAVPAAPPTDGVYTVQRGDTLSRIADRFGLDETQLMARNDLRNRNRIYVGQTLRLTDEAVQLAAIQPRETSPASASHPDASAELTLPRSLTPLISETRAASPEPSESEEGEETKAEVYGPTLLADPCDYSVTSDGTVEVQVTETLGHYADWLDIRASRLRTINHMRYGAPLVVGEFLLLDFSRISPERFEHRRLEHHRRLQEEFFARFEIDGTSTHTTRRGDSLWTLAEHKYEVPLWLLRQYNPDLDFGALQAGMRITIPQLKEREAWGTDSGGEPKAVDAG